MHSLPLVSICCWCFSAWIYSWLLTLSLPGYHLKTINNSVKFKILMHFLFRFCERTSIKLHDIESDLLYSRKIYFLWACVCIFFSPEILQTEAMKGLMSALYSMLFVF